MKVGLHHGPGPRNLGGSKPPLRKMDPPYTHAPITPNFPSVLVVKLLGINVE